MFKNDKPKIEFICHIPELMSIEECLPKPAKHFIPEWWKKVPSLNTALKDTVKECPGIADWFSQGYVIPMWSDTFLQYDKKTKEWATRSSNMVPPWSIHNNGQFIDYVDPTMYGSKASLVFKTHCPWAIKTPPGYSVFQMPLFYHFDDRISVLPGVVDTDIYNEINQQVLYHGTTDSIFIKRGEPLVLYIPFKRTKYDMVVREANEKDKKDFSNHLFNFSTKFVGQRLYRTMQRARNSQEDKK